MPGYLDEFHERSLDADIGLAHRAQTHRGMLREDMRQHGSCPGHSTGPRATAGATKLKRRAR